MIATVGHPAKYTDTIQDALRQIVWMYPKYDRARGLMQVLDPFAGVGTIHKMFEDMPIINTVGVEIEPEWARAHPGTVVGDATALPFPDESFDMVVTSPCYGNRMADLYDGRDGSRRSTYRISLGHRPNDRSAAGLQWGKEYRRLHWHAWVEAHRVLRPGGEIVVNISNHIRSGRIQRVVEWHLTTLCQLFVVRQVLPVQTPRMRQGANHDLRVESEHVLHLRKVA